MINFKNRFHGHNSLSFVYKKGQAIRSNWLVIKYVKNTYRQDSRMAVVIGKKVLKSAVGRNRIRRRIYEILRLKLPKLNAVYDIVVVVNSAEVYKSSHKELRTQIDDVFESARIEK